LEVQIRDKVWGWGSPPKTLRLSEDQPKTAEMASGTSWGTGVDVYEKKFFLGASESSLRDAQKALVKEKIGWAKRGKREQDPVVVVRVLKLCESHQGRKK